MNTPSVTHTRTFTITVDEDDFLRLVALVGQTTGWLADLYNELYDMCRDAGLDALTYKVDTGFDQFGSNVPVTMERR